MTLPYDRVTLHESVVNPKLHSYRILNDCYKPFILIRNYMPVYNDKKIHESLLKVSRLETNLAIEQSYSAKIPFMRLRCEKTNIDNIGSCDNKRLFLFSYKTVD